MSTEFNIRYARNHDAKNIFRFLCDLEGRLFDQQQFDSNYSMCISGKHNIYLVATDAYNEAIGFIGCHGELVLHKGGLVYEIKELFVEEKYRRQGIGTKLVEWIRSILFRSDCWSFSALVEKQNNQAFVFLERFGFHQTLYNLTLTRATEEIKS